MATREQDAMPTLTDESIIELYNKRLESAVAETQRKYGAYCLNVAESVLRNREDAEECVNDALLVVWNSIPPESPISLPSYILRIVRNTALNRLRYNKAEKRGGDSYERTLEELEECIPNGECDLDDAVTDDIALEHALTLFLTSQPPLPRMVFMRRYWYMKPTDEIAKEFHITGTRVRVMLHRMRKKLALYLQKEGINI